MIGDRCERRVDVAKRGAAIAHYERRSDAGVEEQGR